MLPKEHRLRHDKEIKALFAKSESVFDNVAGIKYRKNGLAHSRFGVVVGSKISKKAVVRNRLRRQIRSYLHKHLSELKTGYDVLFLVRPSAANAHRTEIYEHVERVLKKGGLFL